MNFFDIKLSGLAKFIITIVGASLLITCTGAKSADHTIDICLGPEGMTEDIINMFHEVSLNYGYTFHDGGREAKEAVLRINRDKSSIPEGISTFFSIKKKDGSIVLVGDNFGNRGYHFLVAFFYQDDEGISAPFNQSILSKIESIPEAKIHPRGPDGADKKPCLE